MSSLLEHRYDKKREPHPDPIIEMVVQSIPKVGKPQYQLQAQLPSRYGIIPLLGIPDEYNPKTHELREDKTGTKRWTPAKAKGQGQLKFYALMIWLNHNVIAYPKTLMWIETERIENEIRPTGKVVPFPVVISPTELLEFSRNVANVAAEISSLYKEFINNNV